MFKDFNNHELKRSMYSLIIMMVIFMFLFVLVMDQVFIQIKEEYVRTQAAIVGTLLQKHPQLQQEIVPLITKGIKGTKHDKGLEVLREYGYTEKMETIFLPQVQKWLTRLSILVISTLFVFFVIIVLLNGFQYRVMYRNIRTLTSLTNDVLECKYDSSLPNNREGDFSRLINRFDQMRLALKNNMLSLKKEKTFLVHLLSDITHQLKTPLASLILFTEMMSEKKMTEDQRRIFLENSQQQLERMEWLIKTFLMMAKLDAGAIMLNKKRQSLNQTICECINLLQDKAQEKDVDLSLKTMQEVTVEHDRQWLIEALTNIVENGIEHTGCGGYVKVIIENSPLHFKVKIQDSGEGMERKEVSQIFERFYQGSNDKKGNTVGIGLSLSKAITEAHGGYIEVESEKRKGSVFSLVFIKN